MMKREIVVNLLYNLGGRSEVERYLREYTQPGPARTAVVKIGGALISDDLDDLSSSVAFLKHVGMAPVVVHGAGPQLSAELKAAGIECAWVDGLRVTTPGVLAAAHRLFLREGSRLAEAIDAHGVRARTIPTGVFEVVADDPERLGLVGRVVGVDLTPVKAALDAGYLPVLSPIGVTADGQMLNVNADTAARALAEALRPGKVIYLTETGGIFDEHGRVISAINVEQDKERLIASGVVTGGMARKIEEIAELLSVLPSQSSVSITKPAHLARELFTHKGSGTLVRRGASIRVEDDLSKLDESRLVELLESSFGKTLVPGYFESVRGAKALIAPYTALAIVRETEVGAYLDKFAVTAEAQGAGIGAALWDRLVSEHPRLYWRSRIGNPINPWYMQRADGMQRAEGWLVFWRGLGSGEAIVRAFRSAVGEPVSFVESRPAVGEGVAVG
jgi:bifunctional N-acetylglutamate synthase/kinase